MVQRSLPLLLASAGVALAVQYTCDVSGGAPVVRRQRFPGGLCQQYQDNTCVNSSTPMPQEFTSLAKMWRSGVGLSAKCSNALRLMGCYALDPWVGTGRAAGTCSSLCSDVYAACQDDFFAPASAMAGGVGSMRPCTTADLVCAPLASLLRAARGWDVAVTGGAGIPGEAHLHPPQTCVNSGGEPVACEHVSSTGEVWAGDGRPNHPATPPDALRQLGVDACAALGLPVAGGGDTSGYGSGLRPGSTPSRAKCFSGRSRPGTGVPEPPVSPNNVMSPMLLAGFEAVQAVWMRLLYGVGLASEAQYASTISGRYSNGTVRYGLGYFLLFCAVSILIILLFAALCIVAQVGEAEEQMAEAAARRHQAAAAAASRARQVLPPAPAAPDSPHLQEAGEASPASSTSSDGWSLEAATASLQGKVSAGGD